ncbi:putative transmembrane anti-sigma factor [Agrobacterium albertimagni AOL15]|uniref:Putative transmembrane anti-sigma factor n=1 Tax=Agrobacterium albertimagni AOL15 TaxID=1156935 RepID=K2Q5M4_9HYPH|nr:anti-sigma factor [Agrobacterium albertimagni]EKF60490.1 putative transmembrane anti-sigma factor [Agrobacterium albertimagni AOL15]
MTRAISDEMLMAFADGELAPAEQEEIEKALAEDDELAERLAVFMDTRHELAATMKPLIDVPVPAALEASLTAAIATARQAQATPQTSSKAAEPHTIETVVPLRPRASSPSAARSTGSAISSPWGMALAASFVGIVVGLGGFLLGQSTGVAPDGANLALNEALETLPSGADRDVPATGESLHMIASFRDAEGHLCREYERKAANAVTMAVACHGPAGWQTRFALTNPVAEGYVPASTTDTLDAFLSGIGAGAPLSPEEEIADIEALRTR